MTFLPVDEQLAVLRRGVVDLVHEQELRERLLESLKTGRPLRVKLGIDPSSPDIHLGHTVVLRKLRDFQGLGHTAIVLWGTATAMVGDPTGRNKTRPALLREQVEANRQTYRAQVAMVLDVQQAEERENGEWFHKATFMDCVALAGRYTVAQILDRDDFQNRYRDNQPISVHEFLYPLLQGWDSVELKADVELGGTDQLFNLMVGRELQKQSGMRPQVCMTMPLLEGLDGSQKMSKSLGNYVGVADAPGEKFQKLLRLPNELLGKYFNLLTDVPEAAVADLVLRPLDAKFELARHIVTDYHGEAAAQAARAEFDRMHQKGGVPDAVADFVADAAALRDGKLWLPSALALAKLVVSNSDGKRMVQGGGVRVGGEVCKDANFALPPGKHLLQVGKSKAAYVIVPS
ncbi:tyrosine--tRNA ligase [Planctomycetota bacterium]|nr:tyrosine--tRNA ligase [Planctomycetota bacterium]